MILTLGLALTGRVLAADTLVVGATAVPHAEILELIKPRLAAEGVTLEIRIFTDYVQPNVQLAERRLDANFFQHQPFLDAFNTSRKEHLESLVAVHIEPVGAYSRKIKALAELSKGATVALPNDPSNSGRALQLLARAGVITLRPDAGILATARDIVENRKKLRFRELEAAMLPRVLGQVDLALINTNYALEAGLKPTRDALLLEDAHSPYANILVVRPDNRNSPALAKLAAALTSPEVRQFIEKKYQGAVVPAF